MEFGRGLLILAAFLLAVNTNATETDRYKLPPSKVNIKTCQREALRLHPGMIEKQRMLPRHGEFWVEYEILARDGSEWLVLCDLTTGKIIREQKLIDDAL